MKNGYYLNRSFFELGITSELITPEEITQTLGIQPDRSFRKGETYVSKQSGSTMTHTNHLWAKSSKEIVTELQDLSPHFIYFEEIFKDKISLLEQYKKDERFEVNVWIWIETENAGIGFDLNDQQLGFFNKICNRCSFKLLAIDNITP